ncbi:MAG: DNA polymerase III subunit delta [Gemmatimonadota bacterium]
MSRGKVVHNLETDIARGRFEPVYYLHGDEEYLKERALQKLIARATEPSTRDFNLDQRRAASVDSRSLGTLFAMPPVLAERRVIVLRDVVGIKKDTRAVLDRYLAQPAPDIVLVIVSAAGEKIDAKLAQSATAIEFSELDGPSAADWIAEHAREVHDATISREAAELLLATVGADLAALATELDKSVSFGGKSVDTAAIEAVVGVRHGETLGDFLRAVAQRRADEALKLISPILAQPKNGLIPVLSALGSQMLALGVASAARRGGASVGAVRNRLWELLKGGGIGSLNTGGSWGDAVERWATCAALWSETSIRNGLRALLIADRSAKDSRIATDEQILSTAVLELCGDTVTVVA